MVARAARTGGRRPGVQRSVEGFHIVLAVIIVLGVFLVWYSRYQAENGSTANSIPPTTKQTWITGISFDVCGTVEPNLPTNPNLYTGTANSSTASKTPASGTIKLGLYTKGDGIIRIHPLSHADAGDNATLGRFVTHYPGLALSQTEFVYPGKPAKHNGDTCGGKPGTVQVKIWPNTLTTTQGILVSGNPADQKLGNDQLITVAFLPKGAHIPRPPQSVITTLLSTSTASTTTTTPASASTTAPAITASTVPPIIPSSVPHIVPTTAPRTIPTTSKAPTTSKHP